MLGIGFGELVIVGIIGLVILGGAGVVLFLVVKSQKNS